MVVIEPVRESIRVLHCIPSLQQGGAEQMLVNLSRSMPTLQQKAITIFEGPHLLEPALGIPHQSLGMRRSVAALPSLPSVVMRFLQVVREFQPDVVVGWLYYGALIASIARRKGAAVIWSLHAADFELDRDFKPLTRAAIRLCARLSRCLPSKIHYCSQSARRTHAKLGFNPRRDIVIPNGVDVRAFDGPDPAHVSGWPKSGVTETPTLGCAARFDPQKDHGTLLAAMVILKRRGRRLRLLLAGRGCEPDNPNFGALILQQGSPTVELLGEVRDMAGFYRSIDALVLSSASGEAMPMAVLEALASGLPVVATDVGELPDIVGPFGLLCPPRDPEAMATAIEGLFWNRPDIALRSRECAPEHIARTYSLESSAHRWQQLIEQVTDLRDIAENH